MPSDPRFLPVVRAAIDGLSCTYGLSKEDSIGITLAIDEAMANVIRHAYKSCYEHTIQFDCVANDQQMEFTFLDQGEPPDPARICAQQMDDIALSGRGTHLIRAVMDEVSYDRVPGGNQLRLIKRLHDTKALADKD